MERMRERHPANLSADYLADRAKQGWRVAAIEWERDLDVPAGARERWTEDVPYGLKVSDDCCRLEENPEETAIMVALMEQIVQDKRFSEAAQELNRRGYRTRTGAPWGPAGLFELLPRLIEVGPRIFRTDEWADRRKALARVV